jgi:hypothetical protein
MKTLALLLLLSSPAFASKKPPACANRFSIIEQDTLGNTIQGVKGKQASWITDLEKKYPDVCYAAPDPSITTVFVIKIAPDTYHGTRVITTTNPSTGTVSDNQGNTASYNGTSQSSTAVPYSFEYGKYMLTVETLGPEHQVTVRHRFQQDGIYHTLYGIPLGGRGHHPEKAVIEDAVKWLQAGGLNDPLQAAQ